MEREKKAREGERRARKEKEGTQRKEKMINLGLTLGPATYLLEQFLSGSTQCVEHGCGVSIKTGTFCFATSSGTSAVVLLEAEPTAVDMSCREIYSDSYTICNRKST